jgi:predicted Zn-dependent protease
VGQAVRAASRQLAATAILVVAGIFTGGVSAIQLISVADEIAIGKQAQAEVRKTTPELKDSAVQAYLSRIGRRLAAQARGGRYPYSFSIANHREINAFALPGGPIWVNSRCRAGRSG